MARKTRRTASKVTINLPTRPLKYADAIFEVKVGGERLGKLQISQGGVDWWPKHAKKGYGYGWKSFAALLGR